MLGLVIQLLLALALASIFMSKKSPDLNDEELYATLTRESYRLPADYDKFLRWNRRRICGGLFSTPYNVEPLDKETAPLRTRLLRFHDFGLLTTSSKPFKQPTAPYQGGFWHGSCIDPIPNAFSQWRQRPSVVFLLPSAIIDPKACEHFLSGLLSRKEIYTS